MTRIDLDELTAVTGGGDCYHAVINLYGLEIGISIGSCKMN